VDARLLIGAMVESHFDAQAILVASADEAVASVSRVLPDLVISDGLMPGGGAIELLGRLRSMPRAAGVPVIVATGSIGQESYRQLRDAGALAVIPKSAGPEEFARAVGAILGVAST
jgi:CheY-like chemotaxis protein